MAWATILGDLIIFACGAAVGHFGPKAVIAFFQKEVKKARGKK